MIILDLGSGENCRNDLYRVYSTIDSIGEICFSEDKVFLKWQLFTPDSINYLKPLDRYVYLDARCYAETRYGIKTFASFFDDSSFEFYKKTNPDIYKIACRDNLYSYIKKIEGSEIICSVSNLEKEAEIRSFSDDKNLRFLYCVADYPASPTVYETKFGGNLHSGISDHTLDNYLYDKYYPEVIEIHYAIFESEKPYGSFKERNQEDLISLLSARRSFSEKYKRKN